MACFFVLAFQKMMKDYPLVIYFPVFSYIPAAVNTSLENGRLIEEVYALRTIFGRNSATCYF